MEPSEINNALVFEIELTQVQFDAFSELLPNGFFLEASDSSPLKTTPHSKKRFFSNDGQSQSQDLESLSSADLKTPKASVEKRVLRDHSKKKTMDQLGRRYSDYDAIAMTTTKPFKTNNEGAKKCFNLLQKLKKHADAKPFISRTDAEKLGFTEIYDAAKDPMDLNMIEDKLRDSDYKSVNQFAADVRKIWNNSFRYSPKGSELYLMTVEISSYFEDLFKEIEDVSFSDTVKDLEKKVEKLSKQLIELNKSNSSVSKSASKSSSGRARSMSMEDKKVLCQKIKKLPPEYLKGVWDIVGQGLKYSMDDREILEFDVHKLPVKVTRELEKYVNEKMTLLDKMNKEKNKPKGKGRGKGKGKEPEIKQITTVKTQYIANVMAPIQIQPAYLPMNMNGYQQFNMQQSIVEPLDNGLIDIGKANDTDSRSGDSSFISDSDSESELGNRHKNKIVF